VPAKRPLNGMTPEDTRSQQSSVVFLIFLGGKNSISENGIEEADRANNMPQDAAVRSKRSDGSYLCTRGWMVVLNRHELKKRLSRTAARAILLGCVFQTCAKDYFLADKVTRHSALSLLQRPHPLQDGYRARSLQNTLRIAIT